MDGISFLVFVVMTIAYFMTGKKYVILAWLSGASLGFLVGLVYAASVVNNLLR